MFARLLILLFIIGAIRFDYVYSNRQLGGYTQTRNEEMQTKMVNLAREQLKSNTSLASDTILIVRFESQIVSGTNYRLVFNVGEQYQCTLVAYQPLPYKKQDIQVTSFTCNDTIATEYN
jgi:hypothetical protein